MAIWMAKGMIIKVINLSGGSGKSINSMGTQFSLLNVASPSSGPTLGSECSSTPTPPTNAIHRRNGKCLFFSGFFLSPILWICCNVQVPWTEFEKCTEVQRSHCSSVIRWCTQRTVDVDSSPTNQQQRQRASRVRLLCREVGAKREGRTGTRSCQWFCTKCLTDSVGNRLGQVDS